MQDEVKKYLQDVLTSIEHINEFRLTVKGLEEYSKNVMVRRAVERELEIIGEAINGILEIDSAISISNARKMVNTRNKIIHGYDEVEDNVIWAIVIKHIPILKNEIEKLLNEN